MYWNNWNRVGNVRYFQWETWLDFPLISCLNPTVFPPSLQLIENSVCLLRNLSYQVHREIPGCERYQEAVPLNQGPAPSSQKGGCFSSRKSKGLCERGRDMYCAVFFLFFSVSRRNICGFVTVDSSVSLDWYWGAHKQNTSLTQECQQFPQLRESSSSLLLLSVCVSLRVLICFSLHYTPPHHCFMAFIERRQRISVNIHVNKSDPAYPSC